MVSLITAPSMRHSCTVAMTAKGPLLPYAGVSTSGIWLQEQHSHRGLDGGREGVNKLASLPELSHLQHMLLQSRFDPVLESVCHSQDCLCLYMLPLWALPAAVRCRPHHETLLYLALHWS